MTSHRLALLIVAVAGAILVAVVLAFSHSDDSGDTTTTTAAAASSCPLLVFVDRSSGTRSEICVISGSQINVPVSHEQFLTLSTTTSINGVYNLDPSDPSALVVVNGTPVGTP